MIASCIKSGASRSSTRNRRNASKPAGSIMHRSLREHPSTRSEDSPAAFLHLRRGLVLARFEVRQIRLAKRTRDRADVKIDVILQAGIEHLQDVGAKLFAAGTRQAGTAPNRADRVI